MRESSIEVLGTSDQNWVTEKDKAKDEPGALYNHIGSDEKRSQGHWE